MQQMATLTPTSTAAGSRLPLRDAADQLEVTPTGALKILKRANAAIRDDGRWYVHPANLDAIEAARRILGKLKSASTPPA